MANTKHVERGKGAVAALAVIPEPARDAVEQLALQYKRERFGDGTLHNTYLYLLCKGAGISPENIWNIKEQRGTIQLHIPVATKAVLDYVYERTPEAGTFSEFVSESILKGLEKEVPGFVRAKRIDLMEDIKVTLEDDGITVKNFVVEGRGVFKPVLPNHPEKVPDGKGGVMKSHQSVRYRMKSGALQRFNVDGVQFAGVKVEDDE